MDYIEACDILGLKPNFTDQEFKEKSRELALKYHPDNFSKISDESLKKSLETEMKKINAAKSFFKDSYRKYGSYHYFYTKDAILNYIKKLMVKARSYKGDDTSREAKRLEPLIISLQYNMLYNKTKESVDKYFAKFKEDLRIVYNSIRDEYLPYLDGNESFNYDVPVTEFVNHLKDLKATFIKRARLKVEGEVLKYELYPDYLFLKEKIEKIKKEALKKMEESDFKTFKACLEEMNNNIRSVFDRHFVILERFKAIKDYLVNKYSEETIASARKAMEQDVEVWYMDGLSLEILKDLNKIQTLYNHGNFDVLDVISKVEEKIVKAKELEEDKMRVKEVFIKVSERFYNKMKLYNLSFKVDAMMDAYRIYGVFLEKYRGVTSGIIDSKSFFKLEWLTFEDILQDEKLIEEIDRQDVDKEIFNSLKSRGVI